MALVQDWPVGGQIPAAIHEISVEEAGNAAQHNPSVVVVDGALKVIIRALYGRDVTRNFTGLVDPETWKIESVGELLVSPAWRGWRTQYGLEDMRLFMAHGKLMGSATVRVPGGREDRLRIAVVEIDGNDVTRLSLQKSTRDEKNWMPTTVDGGAVRFVYSTDPLIVLDFDPKRGLVTPGADTLPKRIGVIRGGSQLIPYKEGFLAVVHQVHDTRKPTSNSNPMMNLMGGFAPTLEPPPEEYDHHAVYMHRFALFSRDLKSVKLGASWHFLRKGVEFCAGLAFWRDRYVLSFGAADRRAYLAEVEPATVDALLGCPAGDEV